VGPALEVAAGCGVTGVIGVAWSSGEVADGCAPWCGRFGIAGA
jgi:hypothetical protein